MTAETFIFASMIGLLPIVAIVAYWVIEIINKIKGD